MGKTIDIEPITGRYVRVRLEGREYRTYFEENANRGGRPIVCLHTAGADSIEFSTCSRIPRWPSAIG